MTAVCTMLSLSQHVIVPRFSRILVHVNTRWVTLSGVHAADCIGKSVATVLHGAGQQSSTDEVTDPDICIPSRGGDSCSISGTTKGDANSEPLKITKTAALKTPLTVEMLESATGTTAAVVAATITTAAATALREEIETIQCKDLQRQADSASCGDSLPRQLLQINCPPALYTPHSPLSTAQCYDFRSLSVLVDESYEAIMLFP